MHPIVLAIDVNKFENLCFVCLISQDSANLSLGSGSSEESEWIRQQLLEGAQQPLPNINISPSDLLGTENMGHPLTERIPTAIQPGENDINLS